MNLFMPGQRWKTFLALGATLAFIGIAWADDGNGFGIGLAALGGALVQAGLIGAVLADLLPQRQSERADAP